MEVPASIGEALRQLMEKEQAALIEAVRQEERARAAVELAAAVAAAVKDSEVQRDDARAETRSVRDEAAARVGAIEGVARNVAAAAGEVNAAAGEVSAARRDIQGVSDRVSAAAGSAVTAAAASMTVKIIGAVGAALDERMGEIVEAMSIVRAEVVALKKPRSSRWRVDTITRTDGKVTAAEFERVN